jgi:hypothetical protein
MLNFWVLLNALSFLAFATQCGDPEQAETKHFFDGIHYRFPKIFVWWLTCCHAYFEAMFMPLNNST